MKINDNPLYKSTLDTIKHDEKSEDLFDAISFIDDKQTSSGSKIIDSDFTLSINSDNKIEINYMLNMEGLIVNGFVIVEKDGTVLDFGKNIRDRDRKINCVNPPYIPKSLSIF